MGLDGLKGQNDGRIMGAVLSERWSGRAVDLLGQEKAKRKEVLSDLPRFFWTYWTFLSGWSWTFLTCWYLILRYFAI